jgi:hypothetical protein
MAHWSEAAIRRPRLLAGVIDDARGRHRRRLLRVAAIAACAGAAAGAALAPASRTPTGNALRHVAPSAVLARSPSMGVACHLGSCDRVGLLVWLRRPAESVSATIAGRPLTLESPNADSLTFVGYLRYALVTHLPLAAWDWSPGLYPQPAVVLRIDGDGGHVLVTQLRVPLEPGWG